LIQWFKSLSLAGKIMLGLAGLIGLTTIYPIALIVFFGLALGLSGEDLVVDERVPSPDGAVDALVVLHSGGGAAGWVDPCIHIVRTGAVPTKSRLFHPSPDEIYCEDDLHTWKLAWDGPSRLVLSGKTNRVNGAGKVEAAAFDGARTRKVHFEYDLKLAPNP